MQKSCSVVNIHAFNVIAKKDAYSMQIQTDMISQIADVHFITVVNAAAFFYQWWTKLTDCKKFTVVSHCESEQFNVAVMEFKGFPAYIQH